MATWRQRLAASLIRDGNDTDAALSDWATAIRDDAAVAHVLYESSFRCFLAGQLRVREHEVPEALSSRALRLVSARAPGDSFLQMPFEEALAFFRAKRLISQDEFDELEGKFKAGGFAAVNLATDTLKERARLAIETSLASGTSLAETIRAIRDGEDEALSLGISPVSHAYLETVVRTNIATAYGAGRYRAMRDPDVIAARPYWIYYTARDSRVSEICIGLDGTVVEADSAEAQRVSPPNHFNCRSSWGTLSAADMRSRGLTATTGRLDFQPDDGFDGAPDALAA